MKTVAFFNNKGGVGKTSLVYHLSWMFAEMGVNVLVIDLDPQSNLTSSFLDDDQLIELWDKQSSRTVRGSVQPLLERLGDIKPPEIIEVDSRLGLVPGDLGLSLFEDRLAETWGRCFDDNPSNAADAFRVTTAFYRIMEHGARQQEADLVLIDVGPNLGAINRAALISADHVVIPLAADLFSLQGLRNLGPTLRDWRNGWVARKLSRSSKPRFEFSIPSGEMKPVGYVVMQPSVRENYPVAAYRRWIEHSRDLRQGGHGASRIWRNPDPRPHGLGDLEELSEPRADGPGGA